ncbi:MAG: SDR family oxidoreductase [Sphingorhabdus sp.]|jgi:NAD(P)-dependent dehydrogenase (short-subunit alcohol dehydrogenase family)|uniref:SDR family NAD(P)-dependent oxidoreductase n=1 Tax=Sphingorhabdus sp. TaxID=1902408 RepID=UPI0025EB77D5|nr:SDR family oxidoreductase [Sphingorhabdus sp.]MCO4092606.1 SDR family oxidoreductase [Sphingorhabdus sp.]
MTQNEIPGWAQGIAHKHAVVTGGSKGLGRAICIALAEAGASVTAVARDAVALEDLAKEYPSIEMWQADVNDPAFGIELSQRRVDIFVNNAGTNHPMPMVDVPVAVLDQMLNLNVRAAYLGAQGAARAMVEGASGGVIINITSQMGHVGSPGRTVYCMTKHALEGLTKAMAVELASHNIRVNSVAPTFIETPMTAPMLAKPEFRSFVDTMIPLGRIGKPEDVAAAVLYLVSPAASMVTGTSLLVDGGWTAQ